MRCFTTGYFVVFSALFVNRALEVAPPDAQSSVQHAPTVVETWETVCVLQQSYAATVALAVSLHGPVAPLVLTQRER